ncbi:hypothetical protein [Microbulbifer taiwanensis]|uniref:Transposase n=1 Tax=Microbulbifer taiwanensis TaxID=986746 RepID=A0ABW1YNE0_9GAMM|nr:hypothetical protein [Microbulbifer taiwanensis]
MNTPDETNLVINKLDRRYSDIFKTAVEILKIDRADAFKSMLKPFIEGLLDELILSGGNSEQMKVLQEEVEELFSPRVIAGAHLRWG